MSPIDASEWFFASILLRRRKQSTQRSCPDWQGFRRGEGQMTLRNYLWRLAPILLALGIAGCSGLLHSNAPPVQVYTLRPGAASAGGTADSSHPAMVVSLRVGHPLAGPGLGSSQIVLLQPDHRM
ncbi:MAG TPA: hypothetical protein VGT04_04670, partial [Acidobacteriaceae bacterium]|nr:hypothetical protein [Acidobacteriaceae bacterium]